MYVLYYIFLCNNFRNVKLPKTQEMMILLMLQEMYVYLNRLKNKFKYNLFDLFKFRVFFTANITCI